MCETMNIFRKLEYKISLKQFNIVCLQIKSFLYLVNSWSGGIKKLFKLKQLKLNS